MDRLEVLKKSVDMPRNVWYTYTRRGEINMKTKIKLNLKDYPEFANQIRENTSMEDIFSEESLALLIEQLVEDEKFRVWDEWAHTEINVNDRSEAIVEAEVNRDIYAYAVECIKAPLAEFKADTPYLLEFDTRITREYINFMENVDRGRVTLNIEFMK